MYEKPINSVQNESAAEKSYFSLSVFNDPTMIYTGCYNASIEDHLVSAWGSFISYATLSLRKVP